MPDYDAMADDYEANPPTADEVLAVEVVDERSAGLSGHMLGTLGEIRRDPRRS